VAASLAIAERFANRGTALADGTALIIGAGNPSTNQTSLNRSGGGGVALSVTDASGSGAIQGSGSGARYGVFGFSNDLYGIAGTSVTNAGAFLDSSSGVGFQGRSTTGIGVVGSTNGEQILSQNQAPLGAYAARFVGGHGVLIEGDLTVSGQKSAAVKHKKDGTIRRVFCMESPEAHFEDFGEAQLVDGSASVTLDDDFSSVSRTTTYQVFLTAYGDTQGLFVSRRTARGFDVKEHGGGKSTVSFGYRVVAPRGDAPANMRLPRISPPPLPKRPSFEENLRNLRGQ